MARERFSVGGLSGSNPPAATTHGRHSLTRSIARKQLRTAASSISLNLAESRGRTGRDRVHFLRIALGSAEETVACLHVADAWGYLDSEQTQACHDKLAHLCAVPGKLTRP